MQYLSSQDINIQEVAEMINMDDKGNTEGNQGLEKCSQDTHTHFFLNVLQRKAL